MADNSLKVNVSNPAEMHGVPGIVIYESQPRKSTTKCIRNQVWRNEFQERKYFSKGNKLMNLFGSGKHFSEHTKCRKLNLSRIFFFKKKTAERLKI